MRRLRLPFLDRSSALPAVDNNIHGLVVTKNAAAAEDTHHVGVKTAAEGWAWRQLLFKENADTAYSATGHSHGTPGITVAEGGTPLDTDITTIDFDASDFVLTESPENEVNIGLAYGIVAGTPAEGDHAHTGVYLPLAGGTVVGPLILTVDDALANAFIVRSDTLLKAFWVSTGYHEVGIVSGAPLYGYSDDLVTKKWELHSDTGDAQFDGTGSFGGALSATAITGTSHNSPLFFSSSDADIQGAQITNSNNAVYQDAVTVSVVLGTGTWSVLVWGHISGFLAGSLDWRARVELGASNATALTTDISADDYHTIICNNTFTGQSGTLTAAIAFQPVTNGNSVAIGSSSIFAMAWRTS